MTKTNKDDTLKKKRGPRWPRLRNSSSYKLDYDKLFTELERARKDNSFWITLAEYCERSGFTIQRIYLLKSNNVLGINTVKKLIACWVDVKSCVITNEWDIQ